MNDGTYEFGFAAGELQAFRDRQLGRYQWINRYAENPHDRAFIDGYNARSPTWVEEAPKIRLTVDDVGLHLKPA